MKCIPLLEMQGFELQSHGKKTAEESTQLKTVSNNMNNFFNSAFNKDRLNVEDFIHSEDSNLKIKKV